MSKSPQNGDKIQVPTFKDVLYRALLTIFCTKIRLIHLGILAPLYSLWNTPTCFSPQGPILWGYWYISWAASTKYVTCTLLTLLTKCTSNPWGWVREDWNMLECFRVNKVVLINIIALVGLLCKIVQVRCVAVITLRNCSIQTSRKE